MKQKTAIELFQQGFIHLGIQIENSNVKITVQQKKCISRISNYFILQIIKKSAFTNMFKRI